MDELPLDSASPGRAETMGQGPWERWDTQGSLGAMGQGPRERGSGLAGAVYMPLGALCSVCVPISGLEEQTGKWFSAVSLQLTNRAQNSAGVAQLSQRQR